MTTEPPKRRRWFQFRLRTLLIALGCLLLVIAVTIGIKNGWIGLQGRPIQRIQELQAPSEARNRQIDELVNP
jgi:hypothetical protein